MCIVKQEAHNCLRSASQLCASPCHWGGLRIAVSTESASAADLLTGDIIMHGGLNGKATPAVEAMVSIQTASTIKHVGAGLPHYSSPPLGY
jgi:hypothetical protein